MDIVNEMVAYEMGEMEEERMLAFFQELVDSGLAWQLQGSYGRQADQLIKAGLIDAG